MFFKNQWQTRQNAVLDSRRIYHWVFSAVRDWKFLYQSFLYLMELYVFLVHKIAINPFPNKPWFLRVSSKGLLKTLGKGEIFLFPMVFSTILSNYLQF